MKTLIKIGSFIMCILITIVIVCDSYMLFLTVKMSGASLFENISIIADYKIFDRLPIASTSLIATIILLLVFVTIIVKNRIISITKE